MMGGMPTKCRRRRKLPRKFEARHRELRHRHRQVRRRNGRAASIPVRRGTPSAPCSGCAGPVDRRPHRHAVQRWRHIAPAAAPPLVAGGRPRKFGAPSSRSQCTREVPHRTIGGAVWHASPSSIGSTPKSMSSPTMISAGNLFSVSISPRCCGGMASTKMRSQATRSHSGPGGMLFNSGTTAEDVRQVEIRAGRKREEFEAATLDTVTKRRSPSGSRLRDLRSAGCA